MTLSASVTQRSGLTPRRLIALIGLACLALIAGAWFFEIVVGLRPCKLCLEQRLPHYAAIGLAAAGLVLARSPRLQWLVLLGLAGLMALEHGARRLSCRRRMGLVRRPERLRRGGCAGRGRRAGFHEAAPDDAGRQLHGGGVAVPRPVARGLERAGLARPVFAGALTGVLGRARAERSPYGSSSESQ
jgi:hypothetical protein